MFETLNTDETSIVIKAVHTTLLRLFELYYPTQPRKGHMRSSTIDIDKLTASPEPAEKLAGEILREIQVREKKPLRALKPAEIERYTVQLAKIAQEKAVSEHPPRPEVAEKILESLRKEYAST